MACVTLDDFKKIIWEHYSLHGRLFEWRHTDDSYKVFISEVMLQQTQTSRVAQKFPEFIATFPNFKVLASASLKQVLTVWQGLGYNRRGMFLHRAASNIMNMHNGILPNDPDILVTLPGIGKATAASICAFAFNAPTVFIETNIRSVYIYFFFAGRTAVDDKEIVPLIKATLDENRARDWYYALMDYGVMLKKNLVNPSRKSKHYTKQSKFEGSDRQIRGMILKILTQQDAPILYRDLVKALPKDSEKISKIINALTEEEFIVFTDTGTHVALLGDKHIEKPG